ncbi:DUF4007 family protein [Candidatus Viridilinea mediisalina]|nr:DUF4007 family protein [Candidatus Viridilinea mediisalina]
MRTLCFNQKFPLDRELMKGLLQCIKAGEASSKASIGAYLGINPYKIEGLRGWFCKLGLGSFNRQGYYLSEFGALAAEYDPDLVRPGTLWLLHYFLVSEHDERAEVWYRCFNEFVFPGKSFTPEELREYVERVLPEQPENRDAVKEDAKALVKTYTNTNGLGELAMLSKQPQRRFRAALAKLPENLIAAYALFDTWQRRYPGLDTIRLSQIADEPEFLGRVFVATPSQVRDMVLHLQAVGLLSFADTQHEPVTRRYHEPVVTLLQRYYAPADGASGT